MCWSLAFFAVTWACKWVTCRSGCKRFWKSALHLFVCLFFLFCFVLFLFFCFVFVFVCFVLFCFVLKHLFGCKWHKIALQAAFDLCMGHTFNNSRSILFPFRSFSIKASWRFPGYVFVLVLVCFVFSKKKSLFSLGIPKRIHIGINKSWHLIKTSPQIVFSNPFQVENLKQVWCLSSEKSVVHRGKLGNGEHLSLEAYKYKENNIYVLIIMQHKEHLNFYPEIYFYWL